MITDVQKSNPAFSPDELAEQHGVWDRAKAYREGHGPPEAALQRLDSLIQQNGGKLDPAHAKAFEKQFGLPEGSAPSWAGVHSKANAPQAPAGQ